jgi:hypothetical protein
LSLASQAPTGVLSALNIMPSTSAVVGALASLLLVFLCGKRAKTIDDDRMS